MLLLYDILGFFLVSIFDAEVEKKEMKNVSRCGLGTKQKESEAQRDTEF